MTMTLDKFLSELRLDLKDTGTLWSDTELDRCIKLAVWDLSRFMPLEKVYEQTVDYTVDDEDWTSPATTALTIVVNAGDINVASGSFLTIAGQPDIPRPLTITITDANNSAYGLVFIVIGTDENDVAQTETFNWSRGYSKTITGKKIFKKVYSVELDQTYGPGVGDTASIGYALFTAKDVWVNFANKPIKPESESIENTAGTTTYTRGTDYEMDYINGKIHIIAGGSLVTATGYHISYTKSRLGIDISAIISELIRIQRVEYPVDSVPQKFASFNIWGNFMYIGSQQTNKSQAEITDGEHVAIYYEKEQVAPTTFAPGSYPEFMDTTVALGARAYALLMMALKYEHQSVTDMATLRTSLGYIGIGGASPTLLMSSISTALAKINTYLVSNTNEDSKYWLTKITTDIAGLRTNFLVAVDAANAYFDEVDVTDLSAATDSAEGLLKKYEDYIDTLNIGAQVAQVATNMAQAWQGTATARTNAGLGYIQEANMRLDNLRSYIEQANGWGNIASGFLNEALAEIQQVELWLTVASRYADTVNGDLVMSDRFRTEGLERMNEFQSTLKSKSEWRRKVAIVPVSQPA
jgi:hypothetical protein